MITIAPTTETGAVPESVMAALNVSTDLMVPACTIDNGGSPLKLFFKPIVAKDVFMLGKGELNLAKLTSTKKEPVRQVCKDVKGRGCEAD